MSSFQFPSNPKDGTILVRDDLKATYLEDSNTWQVEQLQQVPGIEGPPGPKGDPGENVQFSGIVDTYADLPPASTHQNQFWVVDDTNTLYFSDGFEWRDFGSPIQGDGWTSVTETETDDSYTVTFNSNIPELQFTTPNLKGSDGKDGESAAAGLAMQFARLEFDNTLEPGPLKVFETHGPTAVPENDVDGTGEPWAKSVSKTLTMPANSDMALVWWQASSDFAIGRTDDIAAGVDKAYTNGQSVVFRCYLEHTLEVQNASIISGTDTTGAENQALRTVRHNWSGYYLESAAWGKGSLEDRYTNEAFLKLELIQFNRSTEENKTEVQFDHYIKIKDMSTGNITAGDMAITVIPFDSSLPENGLFMLQALGRSNEDYTFGKQPGLTSQEIKNERAADLKNRIGVAVGEIEDLIRNYQMQGDQSSVDDLLDIRSKLLSARNIPGDYTQIHTAISNQIERLNENYLSNPFFFQTN